MLNLTWEASRPAIKGSPPSFVMLNLYLEAGMPAAAPPAPADEWISLREAASGTPYSQEYLSLLARTGKIDAVKRGGTWHTTRSALKAYRKSVGR
jgi:hypothetical protein